MTKKSNNDYFNQVITAIRKDTNTHIINHNKKYHTALKLVTDADIKTALAAHTKEHEILYKDLVILGLTQDIVFQERKADYYEAKAERAKEYANSNTPAHVCTAAKSNYIHKEDAIDKYLDAKDIGSENKDCQLVIVDN